MYTNYLLNYRRNVMAKFKNKNEETLDNFIRWSRRTDRNIQLLHKYGLSLDSNASTTSVKSKANRRLK